MNWRLGMRTGKNPVSGRGSPSDRRRPVYVSLEVSIKDMKGVDAMVSDSGFGSKSSTSPSNSCVQARYPRQSFNTRW